jgi:hypothetical protein
VRFALVCVALFFVWSCDTPPAFPVPSVPPKTVALDVRLPVYVPGSWTVDGFSESLRLELAKYNIQVVGRRSQPEAVARIDLGRITYRSWQEVDVAVADDDRTTPLGRIRVPDLEMTTLDVAAQSVAVLIARWIWRADAVERHAPSTTR